MERVTQSCRPGCMVHMWATALQARAEPMEFSVALLSTGLVYMTGGLGPTSGVDHHQRH